MADYFEEARQTDTTTASTETTDMTTLAATSVATLTEGPTLMAYPPGVSLATVTIGAGRTMFGAPPKLISATVTPIFKGTPHVVHAGSGWAFYPSPRTFRVENGEELSFELPHVNAEGWRDTAGNEFPALLDSGERDRGWAYHVKFTVVGGSGQDSAPHRYEKVFQPLVGQAGPIDVDLVPDGKIGEPVTAPAPAVLSIAGLTGAVTEEQLSALGLGGASDPEIAALVQDATTATGAALAETFATADGVVTSVNGQSGAITVDAKSAYQSWLDAGNTGSEADFIASLKGADGISATGAAEDDAAVASFVTAAGTATRDALTTTVVAEAKTYTDTKATAVAAGASLGTTNLDTVTTPGKYIQTFGGNGTIARNYPTSSYEGPVYVDAWGTRVVQTAYPKDGGVWQRTYNGTAWSGWSSATTITIGGADLDSFRWTGFAVQDTTSRATTEMHYPWVGKRIMLRIIGSGTYAVQQADPFYDDTMFGLSARREYRNGSWTAWRITDANAYATKAELTAAVAGAGDPLERRATLYPVIVKAAESSGSTVMGTLDTATLTTVDLESASNAAQFFNVPVTRLGYGAFSEGGMGGPWGVAQATFCGVTTDSQTVIFEGIHAAYKSRVMFLVDGEPVDTDSIITLTVNGYSAWRLTFPDARSRTVEMHARMLFKRIKYNTGAAFSPYARTNKFRKVGVMADSWGDGTNQAPRTIGTRLAWHGDYDFAMTALGGTGFAVSYANSPAYSDPTRIDPMAAWAPEVCVLWGSINNSNATVEANEAAGQAMIDKLVAARPGIKILLTGHQIAGTQADTYRPMYQRLAAANSEVTFVDSGLALPNVTGPADGAHPSPTGAKRVAEWLVRQIDAL